MLKKYRMVIFLLTALMLVALMLVTAFASKKKVTEETSSSNVMLSGPSPFPWDYDLTSSSDTSSVDVSLPIEENPVEEPVQQPPDPVGEPSSTSNIDGGEGAYATVSYTRPIASYRALSSYRPCYERLNGNLRTAYNSIVKAVSTMRDTKFYFNDSDINTQGVTLSRSELLVAYSAVISDYPEYFWMPKTYTTNQENCVYMKLSYGYSSSERYTREVQLRTKVAEFKASLVSGMSQVALERAVHDFVVGNCTYIYEYSDPKQIPSDAFTIYGALIQGRAVCEGYARAVQYLCTQVGIPSMLQRGSAISSMGSARVEHMWNAVNIDGSWYQLDATWNDPVYTDGIQRTNYNYFNLTQGQMESDSGREHHFNGLVGSGNMTDTANFYIPECNSTAASYRSLASIFVQPGEDIGAKVNAAIKATQNNGGNSVEIFLNANDGYTYEDHVINQINTDWIIGTGITAMTCAGRSGYVRISW